MMLQTSDRIRGDTATSYAIVNWKKGFAAIVEIARATGSFLISVRCDRTFDHITLNLPFKDRLPTLSPA